MSDFDSPWKDLIETYFDQVMTFFFPAARDDFDWGNPHEFLNTEFQQIVRDAELERRLADHLVSQPLCHCNKSPYPGKAIQGKFSGAIGLEAESDKRAVPCWTYPAGNIGFIPVYRLEHRYPSDNVRHFKKPDICVSGSMTYPAVLCHISLVEDVSSGQRQALHDPS